jgi:hypothetical protein
MPNIELWWAHVGPAIQAAFVSLMQGLPVSKELLLLATAGEPLDGLPVSLRRLFMSANSNLEVLPFTAEQRLAFFVSIGALVCTPPLPPRRPRLKSKRSISTVSKLPSRKATQEEEVRDQ